MADFFKTFIKDLGTDDVMLASEGSAASEFSGFIDTGSYALNAALSASLFGGIPNNKAVVLAGDPGTGKSFFALGIAKSFLDQNEDGRIVYFDTEAAITNEMMTSRGVDVTRVIKAEPDTIERFRQLALKILDSYNALDKKDRFPMLMILDSLSMLPSRKETEDIREEKDVRDMTKSQIIKGAFRVLRLALAKANVGLIVTNHVYAVIGAYVPTKEMGGGSGAKYAADTIAFLSKKKEKSDDKIVGNIVHVKMEKSRLSRENTKIDTRILYDGGMDRYYGLLELAEEAGVISKVANKYEFPKGIRAFEKTVKENPEKYFTREVLDQIEVYVRKAYSYNAPPAEVTDEANEASDN